MVQRVVEVKENLKAIFSSLSTDITTQCIKSLQVLDICSESTFGLTLPSRDLQSQSEVWRNRTEQN